LQTANNLLYNNIEHNYPESNHWYKFAKEV
jgi:hypothetical protein